MATWVELGAGVWQYVYGNKFSGFANCFAVRIGDGKLAIVSPSQGTPPAVFTEVDGFGRVVALVATGGHDLGQAEWQARYPDAGTFAPRPSIPTLAQKSALRAFRPLADLVVDAPGVRFVDGPGSKTGSALVRAGGVAYVDELVANNEALPPHKLFALLFRVTGSSPGLKLNRVYGFLFANDKRALANACLTLLEGADTVAFAHGATVRGADVERCRAELRKIA